MTEERSLEADFGNIHERPGVQLQTAPVFAIGSQGHFVGGAAGDISVGHARHVVGRYGLKISEADEGFDGRLLGRELWARDRGARHFWAFRGHRRSSSQQKVCPATESSDCTLQRAKHPSETFIKI